VKVKRILQIFVIISAILLSACAVPVTTPATTPTPTPTPIPADTTVTPTPTPTTTYTLSVSVSPSEAGAVSPPGGQYESDLLVTLTATSASGYTFDYWDGAASDSSHTISIVMDSNKRITAHFRSIETPEAPTPTPISPSEPTPETNADREGVIEIIKANALSKWGSDYQMVNYEVNNQTEAYDWVVEQNAYPDVMERAKQEWQNDYEMVKYTYENQVEAYEWIMSQTAYPDIMERAKQKWGGDYKMVKYEYENQVEAYKALQ